MTILLKFRSILVFFWKCEVCLDTEIPVLTEPTKRMAADKVGDLF